MASYGANSQLGIWRTSTTGSNVAWLSSLENGYTGLHYTDNISGVGGQAIYAATIGGTPPLNGLIQAFDSSTLAYLGQARDSLGTTGGVTGTASQLFYVSSSGGYVQTQNPNANIISGPTDPRGIASDGTTLWLAQFGDDAVARYTTGGILLGYFALTDPTAIAYTTIPEPSAYGMALVAGAALLTRHTRPNPIA